MMINISEYINQNLTTNLLESLLKYDLKMSLSDIKKLIKLDREYNDLVMMRRDGFNEKDILNLKDEMDKFFKARDNGKKYYPKFKFNKCTYKESGIVDKLNDLLVKFKSFRQCYLSKYYVNSIEKMIEWCQFYIDKFENGEDNTWNQMVLDDDTFKKALKMLRDNPYETTKDLNRDIDAEEAAKRIQKALDELKYPWKTSIEPNMMARMNVLPNKIIRISKDAMFNDADIEGLIEHEIKGHVGRTWNAMQTGLYLFVHGLRGYATLDEGIAVWNSIYNVKHKKPNVLFNIAFRYVLTYLSMKMDFCDIFDYIDDLNLQYDIPKEIVFKILARAKREVVDMKLIGATQNQSDYLAGYLLVKDMDDKQREQMTKWNVGIDQMYDIDNFEKFFKLNKIDPL